ncbi:MAG: gas vesicle protein GvpN [Chloroflexi bacterium]|nr:gas vesicle protein GvpN [Chloroflexota bacterium]MCL5111208.1 gas vesicle protein GvpN [Chloroflexota bacterium]
MQRTDRTAVLAARPRADFVQGPFVNNLTERAVAYIAAGYPVHLRGPSGSGKTTLALHVAHSLGRPVMLICGDDEFGSSDLVGGQKGYQRTKVIDNFVHSVLKTEEDVSERWVDNRLTVACREGLTLIYDEFNRSRPEANNILLSVLEERILVLPASRNGASYVKVHPNFVAIFTSNPEDYAGVHRTQDALRDRMVTIDIDYFDRETEIAITRSRAEASQEDAEKIVDLVRAYRATGASEFTVTVRSCIMIAKVLGLRGARTAADDPVFEEVCLDVLAAGAGNKSVADTVAIRRRQVVLDLLRQYCPADDGVVSLPRRA